MPRLHHQEVEIVVENVPQYGTADGDAARQFDREIHLDSSTDIYTTSKHSVTTLRSGDRLAAVILLAGRGATGVHDHSAFIVNDDLLIAVGPYITRLALPSLDTKWTAETDEATCLGVYYSPKHRLILSHGELDIAAISPEGAKVWSTGCADIFTNGFTFDDNSIYARDFADWDCTFDIATGKERGGKA
jgi:hypothetical protein